MIRNFNFKIKIDFLIFLQVRDELRAYLPAHEIDKNFFLFYF